MSSFEALIAGILMFAPAGADDATKPAPLPDADDVADVKALDLRANDDEKMRFALIGLDEKAKPTKAPDNGYKLLLVLPGGSGDASFHPFVKRIYKNALDKEWLLAHLVAPVWDAKQAKERVWPTAQPPWPGAKFTTEEFIEAVVAAVKKKAKVDKRCVFTLSWSSSGPAAYAASLRDKTPITGSFIAMSVFPEDQLALANAKGKPYYLFHSRADDVCKFESAEKAKAALEKRKAKVELVEYTGGHGWEGNVFGDMKAGLAWLEKQAGRD